MAIISLSGLLNLLMPCPYCICLLTTSYRQRPLQQETTGQAENNQYNKIFGADQTKKKAELHCGALNLIFGEQQLNQNYFGQMESKYIIEIEGL